MSAPISNATAIQYFVIALVGLLILRRTYRLTQGVPIGTGRLVALPAFYVAIYVAELASIGLGGAGPAIMGELYGSFALDAALLVVGGIVAYGYSLRHLEIYRAPGETAWSYRMNPLLPIVYVVLFFARVGIETVVLNQSPFAVVGPGALAGVSAFALSALFAVDALWGLSTGFLIGRSAAVYHAWRGRLADSTPAAGPALP
ncbi:MAG: hypothetical protein ACREDE_00480 [Thermoplasmata archaeon]